MPFGVNENGRYLLQKAYDAGIRDARELSVFMGQTEVECGRFKQLDESFAYSGKRLLEVFPGRNGMHTRGQADEIARLGPEGIANAVYGGRWGEQSLGNTEEGDGWRFRGRGFIQVTGRSNYAEAAKELAVDVVSDPDILVQRDFAAGASIQFWRDRVVKQGAQFDPDKATPLINKGALHAQERREAAARWRDALTPDVLQALSRGEISPEARDVAPNQAAPARKEPGETRDPPSWPRGNIDETLMRNLRTTLAHAEGGIGKPWDDASERMSASLYGLARERGFTGTDELRVAFNLQTDRYLAGELVFLQRTGATASPDPYANRIHLATNEAIARPASQVMQDVQVQETERLDQHMASQARQEAHAQGLPSLRI